MTKKQRKALGRNFYAEQILKEDKATRIGDKAYAIRQTKGGYTAVRISYEQ